MKLLSLLVESRDVECTDVASLALAFTVIINF